MSNKLQKYTKIYRYITGDVKKCQNRFAFFCEWARVNNMNFTRDRRKHTITFKYPEDKIYFIFAFVPQIDDDVPEEERLDLFIRPSSFVEAAVAEMQEVLGIDKTVHPDNTVGQ